MPRTRSTKPTASETKESSEATQSNKYALPSKTQNVPKLWILPKKAKPNAQIVTLPNPRHQRPSRYLVCPETGLYEFTKICAPRTNPRSWLIETRQTKTEVDSNEHGLERQCQATKGAELYVATPFDPLFLVLPVLADANIAKGSDEKKRLFLSSDDHFDKLPTEASHLSELLRQPSARSLLEARMEEICDTVDAVDEIMFRLNEEKLFAVILDKARGISETGLPPSMEEKFVTKALEAPILIRRRDMATTDSQGNKTDTDSEVSAIQTETSQSTVSSNDTVESSVSQPSTAATSFTEDQPTTDGIARAIQPSIQIVQLQRVRVAFNFICASYIKPTIAGQLNKSLTLEGCSIDFKPLDEYLAQLGQLRSEAVAARSMGDYSRKHNRDEEDDEARAEKKRKLEEEKIRKASQSRGVRDLKKVNTAGMKKMSDFFKKK